MSIPYVGCEALCYSDENYNMIHQPNCIHAERSKKTGLLDLRKPTGKGIGTKLQTTYFHLLGRFDWRNKPKEIDVQQEIKLWHENTSNSN